MNRLTVLLGLLALVATAQTPKADKAVIETQRIISEAQEKRYPVAFGVTDTRTDEERSDSLAQVMTETNAAVDRFVKNTVSPLHLNQEITEKRIRAIFSCKPAKTDDDCPYVFVSLNAGKPSLIVSYSLGGMEGGDVTIRAYRPVNGRFILAAKTGSNTDAGLQRGYELAMREVPSPIVGESWFLCWFQNEHANGTAYAMHLYAFNGRKFRTLWTAYAWEMVLVFTQNGFTVAYLSTEGHHFKWFRRDSYVLTPTGPKRIASRLLRPDDPSLDGDFVSASLAEARASGMSKEQTAALVRKRVKEHNERVRSFRRGGPICWQPGTFAEWVPCSSLPHEPK